MNKIVTILILTSFLNVQYTYSQNVVDNKAEYLPDIDGILKTKVEFDLNNSKVRFEVRNARFGAKGKVNPFISYRVEVELSDEGKIKMLDAYVRFTPISNLDLYMGQRKIPFSTDYMRSPADNIFANRSLLSKYLNEGMRDIGFYGSYKFSGNIPVEVLLGAVNGTGNNNPQWTDKPNLVGRISAGPEKGIRVTSNLYFGDTMDRNNLAMFGGEVRYSKRSFFIESEYISSKWTDTLSVRKHDNGLYIHSYYNFKLNNKMIYLLTPTARWDFIGDSVFGNELDANRLTLGVNAGFEPKQFVAEIRFNYENYLKSNLPVHTDKITIEFIARF
jgi:hypothetical protein